MKTVDCNLLLQGYHRCFLKCRPREIFCSRLSRVGICQLLYIIAFFSTTMLAGCQGDGKAPPIANARRGESNQERLPDRERDENANETPPKPKLRPRQITLGRNETVLGVSSGGTLLIVRNRLDQRDYETFLVNVADGKRTLLVTGSGGSSYAVFSPEEKCVLVGGHSVLDLVKSKRRELSGSPGAYPKFSGDGRFITDGVGVWEADTGKLLRRIRHPPFNPNQFSREHILGVGSHLVIATGRNAPDGPEPSNPDNDHKNEWTVRAYDMATGNDCRRAWPTTYAWEPGKHSGSKLPHVRSNHKLTEAGALAEYCFLVRVSPAGGAMIFPRLSPGALEVYYVWDKRRVGEGSGPFVLADRVTGEELFRFDNPSLRPERPGYVTPDLLRDGFTVTAFVRDKEKNHLLIYDASVFQKYAARERPDLSAKQWEAHWDNLTSQDPNIAFKSMRRLAASPRQTLAKLRERVHPVQFQVDLASLVGQLDGPFAERQKADQALRAAGDEAIPFLEKSLKSKQTVEARRRAEAILKDVRERVLPDPEIRRKLWSIELLEFVGSPEAKRLLERLAGGTPTAWVTLEARASLERLAK